MEDRDERIRIAVALSLCKGIGPVRMVQIYKAFADQWERLPFVPTPELGLPARTEMELSRTGWNALLDKAETSLHKSFLSGIRVHWVEDRLFPERLGPDRLPDGPLPLAKCSTGKARARRSSFPTWRPASRWWMCSITISPTMI